MRRFILCSTAAVAIATAAAPAFAESATPELVYGWTRMDWNFRTPEERAAFNDAMIYAKAPLAGVEQDTSGTIYVTTPRWLESRVPSTLSKVVMRDGKPLLEPFPSWEAHDLSNPDAFRNILGAFIDSKDRMWITDLGFVAGEDTVPAGAQKLVGIDLRTGKEFVRFTITDDLADSKTSFLNDMVVDEVDEVIYITDSGNRGGAPTPSGIIIYDIKTNTARRVLDKDPTVQNDPDRNLTVNGEPVFPDAPLAVGINGITLSSDRSTVYWSITTGDAIYSAPTAVLRDPAATPEAVAASVSEPLRIGGGSDGLTTDPSGRIWITNIGLNRVEVLNPGATKTEILFGGDDFIWPDSLANDFKGRILLTTNHLNHAFGGVMDFDKAGPNFGIWRVPADMPSTGK